MPYEKMTILPSLLKVLNYYSDQHNLNSGEEGFLPQKILEVKTSSTTLIRSHRREFGKGHQALIPQFQH
ncbi:hypothetical protein SK128_009649, partial [Halocaridina rubra]